MKITRVEAIPIRIPLKTGLTTKTAHGEHIDSPYAIVRVHTDQGLIGLGEATLAPRWSGETSESCTAAIETLLSPALEGSDPLDVTARWRQIDGAIRANPFTKAAVEMALWDLAGKAAGVPVYRLLGGKVRDKLPLLSRYKSNKDNWLQSWSDSFWRSDFVSSCKISTFSKRQMLKICRISARLRSTPSCFLTMATST